MKRIKNRNIVFVPVCLLVMLFANACNLLSPTTSNSGQPLVLYDPGARGLHPDFKIFHNDVNQSTLYFRIFATELLFNQANAETRDQSRLTLMYKLFSSFSEQIIDHDDDKEFIINKSEVADYYTGTVKIPTEEGKTYLLEIILTDQIRQISVRSFVLVDRFNPNTQQNYLVLTYPGNNIGFEKFYYSQESFRVMASQSADKQMRIAYYKPVDNIPAPPFVADTPPEAPREPDSVWTIEHNDQKLYRLEGKGVYVFYPDRQSMNGMYLSNLGENFPQVNTAKDMLAPLQYLATRDEFEELRNDSDVKKSIDEFWLERGGSFATAKELIRVYYNRVVFANLYFSTDRDGWKTDRGMIYLLMGYPDEVIKSETAEEWQYSSRNTSRKYSFEFELSPHSLKAYEFVLRRTEIHRPVWNRALQSWREGRIFSL